AAGSLAPDREGRVRLSHRPERRRQDDAAAAAAAPGRAIVRTPDRRRPQPLEDDRQPGAGLPADGRLRVPGFQAHSEQDRLREHHVRAAGARTGHRGAAPEGVPGPQVGGPAAPAERVPGGALRRRAAARGGGARAHQRPRARPGRRADRQPRSGSRAGDHESLPRHQRARDHGARGHARSRADPPRRQAHDHARAGTAGGVDMRLLGFALDEAVRSVWRRRGASLMAVLAAGASLFVLGLLLLLGTAAAGLLARWTEAAEISVFLRDDATEEARAAIERTLGASDLVAAHAYVSPDEALRRF